MITFYLFIFEFQICLYLVVCECVHVEMKGLRVRGKATCRQRVRVVVKATLWFRMMVRF